MNYFRIVLVLVATAAAAAVAAPSQPSDHRRVEFESHVLSLVNQYCIGCHGPTKQSGDMALHGFKSPDDIEANRATWETIAERVRNREMPPKGKPQPGEPERAAFVARVEAELGSIAGPGRVTLRRLNRAEYANTVRDLFGIDGDAAEGFPLDDVGYGFDNIGDVLSLSPLLLEKYLRAADIVLDAVFTKVAKIKPTLRHFQGHDHGFTVTGRAKVLPDDQSRIIFDGAMTRRFQFEHPGEYTIRLRARGQALGGEWPKVALRVDGRTVSEVEVKPAGVADAVMKRPRNLEANVTLTAGEHDFGFEFLNPKSDPDAHDAKERAINVQAMEIEGPLHPPPPQPSDAYRRVIAARPGTGVSDADAARKVLTAFIRRAYRREPTIAEVAALLKLCELARQNGDDFDRQMRLALKAVLVSPQFLFKVETDPENGASGQAYSLRETELATRLSYFLWSSTPDDELLGLALAGRLRQADMLAQQVRRMLADPKSQALTDNFGGQWLLTRNLKTVAIDPQTFPQFDEPLRAAMIQETTLFFDAVVREDRSVLDFLDADFTFVNDRLARHYGIAGVKGSQFRRVSLRGTHRAGLLTQASILTVTSNPTRTSPVKRGKFILENILGTPIPPPPPDVPELPEAGELHGTLRQRMEQHRANPTCASCHDRMDPPGLAFEHFDATGAWRERDGGAALDTAGTLPDGRRFADADELRGILKERHAAFQRCVAEKLLTYALGRGLGRGDRAAVDQIGAKTAAANHRFSALVLAIVDSEPFQKRLCVKGSR